MKKIMKGIYWSVELTSKVRGSRRGGSRRGGSRRGGGIMKE